MVGTRFNRNSKLGAEERIAKLGDQFFHCVSFGPKTTRQVTVTAVGRSGPVRQFVEQGGVVGFSRA